MCAESRRCITLKEAAKIINFHNEKVIIKTLLNELLYSGPMNNKVIKEFGDYIVTTITPTNKLIYTGDEVLDYFYIGVRG